MSHDPTVPGRAIRGLLYGGSGGQEAGLREARGGSRPVVAGLQAPGHGGVQRTHVHARVVGPHRGCRRGRAEGLRDVPDGVRELRERVAQQQEVQSGGLAGGERQERGAGNAVDEVPLRFCAETGFSGMIGGRIFAMDGAVISPSFSRQ
jgi:hypothetical protein